MVRTAAIVGGAVLLLAGVALGGASPAWAADNGAKVSYKNDSLTYVTTTGQVVQCSISIVLKLEQDGRVSLDSKSACLADIYSTLYYVDSGGKSTYSVGDGIQTTEVYVEIGSAKSVKQGIADYEFRDCDPNASTAGCSLSETVPAPK